MASNFCLRLSLYGILDPLSLLYLLRFAWQEGAWLTLGFLCVIANQYSLAIRCYRRVLRKTPANFEALFLLSDVYTRMGDENKAGLLSAQAMALNPEFVVTSRRITSAFLRAGRTDSSFASRERIVIRVLAATAFLEQAASHHNAAHFQSEILCYQYALEFDPEDSEVLSRLGAALCNTGEFQKALELCDKAILLDPRHGAAWHNKGMALKYLGREEEALSCFRKALSLGSQSTYLLSHRADGTFAGNR